MIASSVVCTGMECANALRLFDSLNIDCFKRREFSNLLTGYVIPAQQFLVSGSVNNSP